MWKITNTEIAKASAEAVWQRWADVASWPDQDSSLVSAAIAGPFETGSIITLKPKGSPTVKVVITQVVPNKAFVSEGKLPLAKLQFAHQLQVSGDQVSFTQTVTMSGPLSGFFSVFMGKKMEQNLVARMSKLAQLINQA